MTDPPILNVGDRVARTNAPGLRGIVFRLYPDHPTIICVNWDDGVVMSNGETLLHLTTLGVASLRKMATV